MKDKRISVMIEDYYRDKDDTLGHKKLAKLIGVGKNRILRIMNKYSIKPRKKKLKYVYPGKSEIVFENTANNKEIVAIDYPVIFSDIFQFELVDQTKVRACFSLHKQTRQILAISFDYWMKADIVTSVIQKTDFDPMTIWHTDQGKQFGAKKTIQSLQDKQFIASMSRAGTPTDNGYAERFVGLFKHAVVRRRKYYSFGELLLHAQNWINFYNQERPHESLNQLPPATFAKINNYKISSLLYNFTV